MKIAIFTDTYDPDINGVARTLKRFTDYLSDQNITFKVFAPKTEATEYVSNKNLDGNCKLNSVSHEWSYSSIIQEEDNQKYA